MTKILPLRQPYEAGVTPVTTSEGVFYRYQKRADQVGEFFKNIARKILREPAKERAVRSHFLIYHAKASLNTYSNDLIKELTTGELNIYRLGADVLKRNLTQLNIPFQETDQLVTVARDKNSQAILANQRDIVLRAYYSLRPLPEVTVNTPRAGIRNYETSIESSIVNEDDLSNLTNTDELVTEETKGQNVLPDSSIMLDDEIFLTSAFDKNEVARDPRTFATARVFLRKAFDRLLWAVENNIDHNFVLIQPTDAKMNRRNLYTLSLANMDKSNDKELMLGVGSDYLKGSDLVDVNNELDPRVQTAGKFVRALFVLPETFPLLPKPEDFVTLDTGHDIKIRKIKNTSGGTPQDSYTITVTYYNNPGIQIKYLFRENSKRASSISIIHNKY